MRDEERRVFQQRIETLEIEIERLHQLIEEKNKKLVEKAPLEMVKMRIALTSKIDSGLSETQVIILQRLLERGKFLYDEYRSILIKKQGSATTRNKESLRVMIANLRNKLKDAGTGITILNESGVGYLVDSESREKIRELLGEN